MGHERVVGVLVAEHDAVTEGGGVRPLSVQGGPQRRRPGGRPSAGWLSAVTAPLAIRTARRRGPPILGEQGHDGLVADAVLQGAEVEGFFGLEALGPALARGLPAARSPP